MSTSIKFQPINAAAIKLGMDEETIKKYANTLSKVDIADPKGWDDFNNSSVMRNLVNEDCWKNRPRTINDLTDGVLIDAYSFEKGGEITLGLLGFANVKLTNKQKVLVVEYSQEGTQYCTGNLYKYGIGARLMMKVIASKRNAKLNTPQQITASVIFDRAEVTYSLQTFGITGPGVSKLNKSGTLSETTYQDFLQGISDLIVEMYKADSNLNVVPQLLPMKNQKIPQISSNRRNTKHP